MSDNPITTRDTLNGIEEVIRLNDHRFDDVIARMYQQLGHYRLAGPFKNGLRPDDIANPEVREYFAGVWGKPWDEIDAIDGAKLIDGSSWLEWEEMWSGLPFMIEFMLRADRWNAMVERFIYDFRFWSKEKQDLKFPADVLDSLLQLFNCIEKKYGDEFDDYLGQGEARKVFDRTRLWLSRMKSKS